MKPLMCFLLYPMSAASQGVPSDALLLSACGAPPQPPPNLVALSQPCCPCNALPSKIHPSAKELGANNDSGLSSKLRPSSPSLGLSLLSAPPRIGDASTLKGILIFTVFYCKLQLAILMMARYVPPHLLSSMKVINLEMPLSCSFFFLELFFSFPLCLFSVPSIWFKHIFTNIVFKPCPFIF